MIPLTLGRDAPLTEEQTELIDQMLVRVGRQSIVARRIASYTPPQGLGVEVIKWDEIVERGDAKVAMKFTTNYDAVNTKRKTVEVPLLQADYKIDARALASSRRTGEALDASNAEAAAYQVAVKEDKLVIVGSDGFNGLVDSAPAGQAVVGADWDTVANISADIKSARKKLAAKNIRPPYQLIVNPEQRIQLQEEKSAGSGISVEEYLLGSYLRAGQIEESETLTAGTALLTSAPQQGHFQVDLGVDLTNTVVQQDGLGNLSAKVWAALVLRVKDANAISKITGIS